MERIIKFRGKSQAWNQFKKIDEGEWVYGNLMNLDSKGSQSYILPFMDYASSLPLNELIHRNMICVDAKTVGQLLGINENKEEVYEDDLFQYHEFYDFIVQVIWVEKLRKFMGLKIGTNSYFDLSIVMKMKKVGNIHDNPELIKDE